MKARTLEEQFFDVPTWSFVGSHRRRWAKKGVGEGRHGWMYSYLTVTSSVNLSTRCVRMLRGSVLPPSCLGGGLLFRHAGRVELHGKGRACTERQRKTGLTRATESNWQTVRKKDSKQAGKWGLFLTQMKNAGVNERRCCVVSSLFDKAGWKNFQGVFEEDGEGPLDQNHRRRISILPVWPVVT